MLDRCYLVSQVRIFQPQLCFSFNLHCLLGVIHAKDAKRDDQCSEWAPAITESLVCTSPGTCYSIQRLGSHQNMMLLFTVRCHGNMRTRVRTNVWLYQLKNGKQWIISTSGVQWGWKSPKRCQKLSEPSKVLKWLCNLCCHIFLLSLLIYSVHLKVKTVKIKWKLNTFTTKYKREGRWWWVKNKITVDNPIYFGTKRRYQQWRTRWSFT